MVNKKQNYKLKIMKNSERQESVVKEFSITDVNGDEHKAILVGVLETTKSSHWEEKESVTAKKDCVITVITTWEEKLVHKALYLGLAITNPKEDTYNLDYGVLRAKGRALKPSKRIGVIFANSRSMLGLDMCDAIMNQQINYIRNNVEQFIKVKPATSAGVDF